MLVARCRCDDCCEGNDIFKHLMFFIPNTTNIFCELGSEIEIIDNYVKSPICFLI